MVVVVIVDVVVTIVAVVIAKHASYLRSQRIYEGTTIVHKLHSSSYLGSTPLLTWDFTNATPFGEMWMSFTSF